MRSTSFGFGKKEDFSSSSVAPGPQKYSVASQFTCSPDKQRGQSLGLGRDSVCFGNVFDTQNGKLLPGPGAYAVPSSLSKISYSMRPKTIEKERQSTPGPGRYPNPLSLKEDGKYPSSLYKRTSHGLIMPVGERQRSASSQRGVNVSTDQPGPGQYEGPTSITATGRQNVHRFRSSGNPGPGMYRIPSEFGHYQDRHYAYRIKAKIITNPNEKELEAKSVEKILKK